MPKARKKSAEPTLNYEAKLWQKADALRNNRDAAEAKQVVPGLLSLKCVSDAFESKHAELEASPVSRWPTPHGGQRHFEWNLA